MARNGSGRSIVWIRRLVPMGVGAGLLYLAWRLVTANGDEVTVDFLVGRVGLPLWQALGTAFLLGAVGVGVYTLYASTRSRLLLRRYRKQLRNLEAEVHQLRNLPLAPAEDGGAADEVDVGARSPERIRGTGS